jgi:hypothetical protein
MSAIRKLIYRADRMRASVKEIFNLTQTFAAAPTSQFHASRLTMTQYTIYNNVSRRNACRMYDRQ